MKPSQICKKAGLSSLDQLSEMTNTSIQTLNNWFKNKPELFNVVLNGAVKIQGNPMNTLFDNIKDGQKEKGIGAQISGYKLAKEIAKEREVETGNKCYVVRVLDSRDKYNGFDREHYSFDVIEVIKDSSRDSA